MASSVNEEAVLLLVIVLAVFAASVGIFLLIYYLFYRRRKFRKNSLEYFEEKTDYTKDNLPKFTLYDQVFYVPSKDFDSDHSVINSNKLQNGKSSHYITSGNKIQNGKSQKNSFNVVMDSFDKYYSANGTVNPVFKTEQNSLSFKKGDTKRKYFDTSDELEITFESFLTGKPDSYKENPSTFIQRAPTTPIVFANGFIQADGKEDKDETPSREKMYSRLPQEALNKFHKRADNFNKKDRHKEFKNDNKFKTLDITTAREELNEVVLTPLNSNAVLPPKTISDSSLQSNQNKDFDTYDKAGPFFMYNHIETSVLDEIYDTKSRKTLKAEIDNEHDKKKFDSFKMRSIKKLNPKYVNESFWKKLMSPGTIRKMDDDIYHELTELRSFNQVSTLLKSLDNNNNYEM